MSLKIASAAGANTMRAWVLEAAGDIADIAVKQVEIPSPAAGQVRVKVAASTTNPVDWKHATFAGLSAFPSVFGCDGAGVVDAVGEGVTALAKGDRVHYFGNVFGEFGTFAEFAIADAHAVGKVPAEMSFADAAVSPCAFWTAYEALVDRMRVSAGDTVFIAAGAGGVGHYATQLARELGAKVITTASGDNVERLRQQGFTVIDYRNENVKEAVMKATDGKGVDKAFDMLSEENALETQQFVRFAGQIAHIAAAVPQLPNNGNFFNALTIHHVFIPGNVVRPDFGSRFVAMGAECSKLLVSGKVKSDISKTVGFDGIKDALLEQKGGRVRGKILISMIDGNLDAVKDAKFAF